MNRIFIISAAFLAIASSSVFSKVTASELTQNLPLFAPQTMQYLIPVEAANRKGSKCVGGKYKSCKGGKYAGGRPGKK